MLYEDIGSGKIRWTKCFEGRKIWIVGFDNSAIAIMIIKGIERRVSGVSEIPL